MFARNEFVADAYAGRAADMLSVVVVVFEGAVVVGKESVERPTKEDGVAVPFVDEVLLPHAASIRTAPRRHATNRIRLTCPSRTCG
jgi:hypothetical protein